MKKWLFVLIVSFILSLIVAPLRGYSFILSGLIGFIVYFAFTSYCLRQQKYEERKVLLIFLIAMGCVAIEMPVRILSFNTSLGSLPEMLIRLLGIVFAFFVVSRLNIVKYMGSLVVLTFVLFMSIDGYNQWIHYLSFRNVKGVVDKPKLIPYVLWTATGDSIHSSVLKDKVAVYYFWGNDCAACFRYFPLFQKLYDHYADNPKVYVASVYVCQRSEEGFAEGISLSGEMKYTIPTLYAEFDNELLEKANIKLHPAVAIFDMQGQLIYLGNIKNEKAIRQLIQDILLPFPARR